MIDQRAGSARRSLVYGRAGPVWRHAISSPLLQLQVLLAFAAMFGGGGAAYGFRNLSIQLVALTVLALQAPLVFRFVREAPRALMLLVGLALAIPLLQMVPLPASIWQGLPGRDLATESFALAGLDPDRWFPASLDPIRTLVAFCGTLVPFAVIVLGSSLDRHEQIRLCWSVVVVSLAAFILGVLQVSSANTFGLLFAEPIRSDVLYATFANRNSTALFFVIVLCVIAGLPRPNHRAMLLPSIAAVVLLFVATILTQSRSGITLLIIPSSLLALRGLAGSFSRWRGQSRVQEWQQTRLIWIGSAIAALTVAAVAVSAFSGGRAADSFARFSDTQTDRPEMWEDGIYAAEQYWPLGSGVGTFDDVFQVHESLEYVSPRRAGRAHNDYIELAIESGAPGVALALGWLLWSAFSALRRGSVEGRWLRLGAGAGVAAIALQSLLDYPLRNQTLLCVAAVLVVILARRREKRR